MKAFVTFSNIPADMFGPQPVKSDLKCVVRSEQIHLIILVVVWQSKGLCLEFLSRV